MVKPGAASATEILNPDVIDGFPAGRPRQIRLVSYDFNKC